MKIFRLSVAKLATTVYEREMRFADITKDVASTWRDTLFNKS